MRATSPYQPTTDTLSPGATITVDRGDGTTDRYTNNGTTSGDCTDNGYDSSGNDGGGYDNTGLEVTIELTTTTFDRMATDQHAAEQEAAAWIDGDEIHATLSHGLAMSIPAFIAVIVAHPKVTAKDATAWPKPDPLEQDTPKPDEPLPDTPSE